MGHGAQGIGVGKVAHSSLRLETRALLGHSLAENLHKLKSLQYLQLALNNIVVLENLEQCESLTKLDLTVNFVEDVLGVECLVNNVFLKEL